MEPDFVKLKAIKPLISGYIRESMILMKLLSVPDENTIHDVRVLMKKSRALLKLTSSQIDKESFDRNYTALREVGRKLSTWRESSVFRKILKDFRKEIPSLFQILCQNEIIGILLKKPETLSEPNEDEKTKIEQINELLNKAGYRLRFLSMNMLDPEVLIKNLEDTYNRNIDIYLKCRNNPRPENLHEFRKRTKDFLYQLYIFRPLNPQAIKAAEKRLESITRNLGKINDLNKLVKVLEYKYPHEIEMPVMDEFIIRVREKQDFYLSKVWPSAFKIFCPGHNLVNLLGFKLLII